MQDAEGGGRFEIRGGRPLRIIAGDLFHLRGEPIDIRWLARIDDRAGIFKGALGLLLQLREIGCHGYQAGADGFFRIETSARYFIKFGKQGCPRFCFACGIRQ